MILPFTGISDGFITIVVCLITLIGVAGVLAAFMDAPRGWPKAPDDD